MVWYIDGKTPSEEAEVEDAMVRTDQFVLGFLANRAKLFVQVRNPALEIADGQNGMLIEGTPLIGQFF
jgi:hypothetical protein